MVIALTPRTRHPYVLRRERGLPAEQRTTFFLRTLTIEERAALMDVSSSYDQEERTIRVPAGTQALSTVRAGLLGWQNLKDEKGADVTFETGPERAVLGGHKVAPPTDACLDRLPLDVLLELANAIRDASTLSDDDAKNS